MISRDLALSLSLSLSLFVSLSLAVALAFSFSIGKVTRFGVAILSLLQDRAGDFYFFSFPFLFNTARIR